MNKIAAAAAAAALLGVTSGAGAADMPVKASPRPAVIVNNWSGFYVGAHLGGAALETSVTEIGGDGDSGIANLVGFSRSLDSSGVIGGAQLGYNWQAGNTVFGVEGDFSLTSLDKHENIEDDLILSSKVPWLATLRARLGYSGGNWMAYVTAGAAVARFQQVYGDVDDGVLDLDDAIDVREARWGWTVGGGLEFALTESWSAKLEYLYLDFGTDAVLPVNTGIGGVVDLKNQMHVVRAGLNYRFGAPVVARY